MNTTQRQNTLDAIVSFQKADFYTPFKEKYGNEGTVDTITFSDYSVSELIALATRAVSQLESILNTNVWQVLPSDNIPLSIYGNVTLYTNISNITDRLLRANYKDAALSIKAQIYFQMLYGFWEKPKTFELKVRESSISKLEHRVELSNSLIDAKVNRANSLIDELEKRKNDLESLINTKKQELETLKSNQSESNTILESIKNTQKNAITSQDAIETLNGKANNIVTALESAQSHIKEQIKTNDTIISQSNKALKDFATDSNTKISKIASDYESVSNNANEVRKMMHFIKDGTLAHSFNKRKDSIQTAVIVWQVLSVVSAILMGVWIFVVFKYLNTNIAEGSIIENSAAIVFANLFINIAKTSPMIVLFWFVLAQYKKERNLLEEYAFREAVAATLTAYLDQLNGEADKNKCALLMNTVEKLYTKPTISRDEIISISLKSKDIADTAKHIKECVKE